MAPNHNKTTYPMGIETIFIVFALIIGIAIYAAAKRAKGQTGDKPKKDSHR